MDAQGASMPISVAVLAPPFSAKPVAQPAGSECDRPDGSDPRRASPTVGTADRLCLRFPRRRDSYVWRMPTTRAPETAV